jgi:hypothetical protein
MEAKQSTEARIKELEDIKRQLLESARVCPVCKSKLEQQIDFGDSWGRYHLTDCICSNCGVRIAKHKYPTKTINNYTYAIVKIGVNSFAVDPVGRTYRIVRETKTATYMSGEMGYPGHEYTSLYGIDTLHWVGLIEDLWSKRLW